MIIITIIAFCSALISAGVWYIFKGCKTADEEKTAIPLSQEEIKKIKTVYSFSVNEKPELKSSIPRPEQDELQDQIAKLNRDNNDLREALQKEVALQTTHDNHEFKNLHDELSQKQKILEQIHAEALEYKSTAEEIKVQLAESQKQCSELKEKCDGLVQSSVNEGDSLRKECERLKESESAEKLLRAQLSSEKERQIRDWAERERSYEEKIASLKQLISEWENTSRTAKNSDDKLKDIELKNTELIKDNEIKERAIKLLEIEIKSLNDSLEKFKEMKKSFEEQSSTQKSPVSDIDSGKLIEKLHDLEKFNSFLQEKERKLQYELIKNRAHSIGLEQICEDLKQKLESVSLAASKNK